MELDPEIARDIRETLFLFTSRLSNVESDPLSNNNRLYCFLVTIIKLNSIFAKVSSGQHQLAESLDEHENFPAANEPFQAIRRARGRKVTDRSPTGYNEA